MGCDTALDACHGRSPLKIRKTLKRNAATGGSPTGNRPSAVRQKVLLDVVAVGLEQHVGAAQLADLLLGALDHAVALARLRIEDLSGPRHLEALLGARLGLDLGHLALLKAAGANARWPKMLINERGVREHIAAATAALNQPGGGKGAVMAEEARLGNCFDDQGDSSPDRSAA